MRSQVKFRNVDTITKGISPAVRKLVSHAHAVIGYEFFQARAEAQERAPWTDRTGNARQSIDIADLSNQQEIRFLLIIGVEYGIWLELANQGKYRIIGPTVDATGQRIMRALGGEIV